VLAPDEGEPEADAEGDDEGDEEADVHADADFADANGLRGSGQRQRRSFPTLRAPGWRRRRSWRTGLGR
jgi:hypothetical protein